MKKLFYIMLISILAVGMLLSFDGVTKKVKDSGDKRGFTYNIGKLPDSLNCYEDDNKSSKELNMALFEGLLKRDDDDKIVCALADSYVISQDGLSYTFKIRQDAKWSDNTNLNATDFVNFFKGILDPKVQDKRAKGLYYIFGAEEYNKGKRDFNGVALRAIDDKTLEIRLNSVGEGILDELSRPQYAVRRLSDKLGDWKLCYDSIAYSGAYTITKVAKDEGVTLYKNEYYFNKDKVKSSKVLLGDFEDNEISMVQFYENKIDLMTNPPLSEIEKLAEDEYTKVVPAGIETSVLFNFKRKNIVNDVNFRRAINTAINRDNIVNVALQKNGAIATSFLNSLAKKNNENGDIRSGNDKEQAKKYLKDSKYDNTSDDIKLVYLNTTENRKIVKQMSKDIAQCINVKIKYMDCNLETYNSYIKNGDYDMLLMDYDSKNNLSRWLSASDYNLIGYSNADFDNVIIKSRTEKDAMKKQELLKSAESYLSTDVPIIPIYMQNKIICKQKKVDDIKFSSEGCIRIAELHKED